MSAFLRIPPRIRRSRTGVLALSALAGAVFVAPPEALTQVELPRVVVLATGGTIASTYDEEIGALRAVQTGDEIVDAVPGLSDFARVSVEQIANANSRGMTPAIRRTLGRRANEVLAIADVAWRPHGRAPGPLQPLMDTVRRCPEPMRGSGSRRPLDEAV